MPQKPFVVVITGATATGKTVLALDVAQKIGGEIICGDSMQVYSGMTIGTAAPTPNELALVPHHLFGFVPPTTRYCLAQYLDDAAAAVEDISARGKLPIIVGGTGLYIDTFVNQVSLPVDNFRPEYRQWLMDLADRNGSQYLHKLVRSLSPEMAAKIHENDVRRIVRALEIIKGRESGEVITQQADPYPSVYFTVEIDRALLHKRINERVDIMFSNGLIDEVRALVNSGVTKECTSMQGIGYKEILHYFRGELTLPETAQLIKRRTRQYAKRQLTWFRRNESIVHVPYEQLRTTACERVCDIIVERMNKNV